LTWMLRAKIRSAIDPRDKFEAGAVQGGDRGVRIQKAEGQLDGFAPPLTMSDRLAGFMIGIADVEPDQRMATWLQYTDELAVRRIPSFLVEMNDHVQADDPRSGLRPDRQRR
jgi:hypothetical protein